MLGDKYVKFHVGAMNVLARLFGGMSVLVGAALCVSAVVEATDRAVLVTAGVVIIAIGVAFLRVRRLKVEDIYAIQRTFGLRRDDNPAQKSSSSAPNNSLERSRDR